MAMKHIARLKGFLRNRSGGVAMAFGLGLPLLVSAAVMTIDLANLASARTSLQSLTDQAVLMGAKEMHLRRERDAVLASAVTAFFQSRAQETKIGSFSDTAKLSVTVSVDSDKGTVSAVAVLQAPLIFADKFARRIGTISTEAEARVHGSSDPICMVTLAESGNQSMHFRRNSRFAAPGCVLYSNSKHPNGVFMQTPEVFNVGSVCSAGGIQKVGRFESQGTLEEDCPPIDDPLSMRALPSKGQSCDHQDRMFIGSMWLRPGTYCGITRLSGSFKMEPGIYNFQNGSLRVIGDTHLWGKDVQLHFSGNPPPGGYVLIFDRDTTINLWAPQHGEGAGLLITGDRVGKTQRYVIRSDNADVLEGTIYIPNGKMEIGSSRPISRDANFTIVVAKEFALARGPRMTIDMQVASLQLNTNYHLSNIPVPNGLGPNSSSAQVYLSR